MQTHEKYDTALMTTTDIKMDTSNENTVKPLRREHIGTREIVFTLEGVQFLTSRCLFAMDEYEWDLNILLLTIGVVHVS